MQTRIMILAILGAVAALFLASPPAIARELLAHEKAVIEQTIKDQLKDPDSARFKWADYRTGSTVYCAEVNAKNSYGGYTGFVPFAVFVVQTTDGKIRGAAPLSMGTGDPASVDTRVTLKMCS